MIIGVCGFSWSGSGAVLDYLMEYDHIQIYNRELTIAFFPDGLSDLDFQLNENCSKFLSSTVAIPRFEKMVNRVLQRATDGKIKELTARYLESLTQAQWIGAGQGQLVRHNQWFYWHIGNRLLHRVYRKLPPHLCKRFKLYPLTNMRLSIKPDDFLQKTQIYTNEILKLLGLEPDGIVVLNQPFPANNPSRCLRYFRNSKAIVVDRDPRDIYVFLRETFYGNSYSVPVDDVHAFIAYYKSLHAEIETLKTSENILYIRFEDLIYEYTRTTDQINQFLGLPKNENARKYFVPEASMINTRVFEKTQKCYEEVRTIERELPEYLYDFDSYEYKPSVQLSFDDNPLTKNMVKK